MVLVIMLSDEVVPVEGILVIGVGKEVERVVPEGVVVRGIEPTGVVGVKGYAT